jgi:hypothetical protein
MARRLFLTLGLAGAVAASLVPLALADDPLAATLDGAFSFGAPTDAYALKAARLLDGTSAGFLVVDEVAYQVLEVSPPNAFLPYWCVHALAVDATSAPSVLLTISDSGDGVNALDDVGVLGTGYELPCMFAWDVAPTITPTAGDVRIVSN